MCDFKKKKKKTVPYPQNLSGEHGPRPPWRLYKKLQYFRLDIPRL